MPSAAASAAAAALCFGDDAGRRRREIARHRAKIGKGTTTLNACATEKNRTGSADPREKSSFVTQPLPHCLSCCDSTFVCLCPLLLLQGISRSVTHKPFSSAAAADADVAAAAVTVAESRAEGRAEGANRVSAGERDQRRDEQSKRRRLGRPHTLTH